MKIVLPVMVTTLEGLLSCVEQQNRLLYFSDEFYKKHAVKICQILTESEYRPVDVLARNGVFYSKDLNTGRCIIWDTYQLF